MPTAVTAVDSELLAAAERAALQAYAPYSGLRVGAAVRSVSGTVYAGCNVENMAFPLGGCAEQAAIAAAVVAEGPQLRLQAAAIAAYDAGGQPMAIAPCGGCRQRLAEFAADLPVLLRQPDGHGQCLRLAELLPALFRLPQARGG